ncbi:MAG TPA: SUMF1/EgtB/PvdO family nonheme iron enzyme [Acidobacteriota bacterium]|nr:SUMF1/EgtB/PvdO family nonheme iron enzyme [Acidobacteriota bacterium]HRV06864.1 SUMF1/EgtB/PvdO family nonheme iron enzyme [Acidobacteriota bacterium]
MQWIKSREGRWRRLLRSRVLWGMIAGIAVTVIGLWAGAWVNQVTATNEYCDSCHVHPQAMTSWKQGAHYRNESGVVTNCVECHLPPGGFAYFWEKAKAGARDFYSFYFKDVESIDWELLSTPEMAVQHTFEESCLRCHQELFPVGLTQKGIDAHLHYRKYPAEVRCISCHLYTGHYEPGAETQVLTVAAAAAPDEEPTEALITEIEPGAFVNYTDVIPGLNVKFEMVAVPGGVFTMGTPENEFGHKPDESPQRQVEVSSFWIGKYEVSWTLWDAYYMQTVTRGKNQAGAKSADVMTGPTPPYGSPDQGWGRGSRPAITMTHYAAERFCEWLSYVTGRRYRLPTEAEWEYAARCGQPEPFPFLEGDGGSWYERWISRLFGGIPWDEALLDEYAVYVANSRMRTAPARAKKPNPWGIYNMYGNVREFCLDYYDPNILVGYPGDRPIKDPRGPEEGKEHVVRGGSYATEAVWLRAGARDHTQHDAWLRTDPQTPKSIWWYSDVRDVGFRIVRELEPE